MYSCYSTDAVEFIHQLQQSKSFINKHDIQMITYRYHMFKHKYNKLIKNKNTVKN